MIPKVLTARFNFLRCGSKEVHLNIAKLIIAFLLGAAITVAQTTDRTATDGSTPSALAAGAGSISTDIDSINLYNGNVNFYLSLLRIGGRGDATTIIPFTLNAKSWRVIHHEV